MKTDDAGNFQAPYLKPGNYSVRVSAAGFKTIVREEVPLQVDDQIRLEFAMEIGDAATSISVEAPVPLVETEKGSLGQVVSTQKHRRAAASGAQCFRPGRPHRWGADQPPGGRPGDFVRVGDRPGDLQCGRHLHQRRAVPHQRISPRRSLHHAPVQNQFALSPSPDATQEFKVMTNSYGPQFGRSGGGVVNVVTKGGSNEFHGVAYEMFRNDRLAANNFFANARDQKRGIFRFNMFGGALGGPLIRNRTFFFGDYQGHREGAALGGRSLTIPTAAQRAGDFSAVLNTQGRPVTIFDPRSTRPNPGGSGFVRTPFLGNRIPSEQIDRAAAAMQRYLPLPNRPGDGPAQLNNWVYAPEEDTRSDQWSIRVDHRFSERNNLFGRLTWNTGDSLASGEFGTIADTQNILFTNDTFSAVLNGTYVFDAGNILNYRAGVTRRDGNQITATSGSARLTDLGFPPAVAAAVRRRSSRKARSPATRPSARRPMRPRPTTSSRW